MGRFPGIPSILDTLVRDATYYFLIIFSGHFLSVLFLFITPVGVHNVSNRYCRAYHACVQGEVQLFPAM